MAKIPALYPGYAGIIVKTLKLVGTRSIIELSAARQRHKEYEELVALIKARAIDALVCRSRDRIARVDALILTIERLCNEHDIIVVPRQSPPPTLDIRTLRASEGAGLISIIESHQAGSAVKRFVHDNKMGMAARVKRNKLFPNRVPWGYRYAFSEEGVQSIAVDEDAAVVLRTLLLDLFVVRRLNYRQIAEQLNHAGQPSPSGRQWSEQSVSGIVESADRYASYITLNRRSKTERPLISVQGSHPPIISEIELAKVQAEKKTRRYGRLPRGGAFSGIVTCTASGHLLAAHTLRYKARGGRLVYYRQMRCHHCTTAHSIPENSLIDCVSEFLKTLHNLADPSDLSAGGLTESQDAIERTIQSLLGRVAELEAKKRKLLAIYIARDDIDPDNFQTEMDGLTRQEDAALAAIDEQRDRLTRAVSVRQDLERILSLRQMSEEIARLLRENPQAAQQFLFQSIRINVSPAGGGRTKIENIYIP